MYAAHYWAEKFVGPCRCYGKGDPCPNCELTPIFRSAKADVFRHVAEHAKNQCRELTKDFGECEGADYCAFCEDSLYFSKLATDLELGNDR